MKHEKIVQEKLNDQQLRKNLYSAMHTLQTNRKNLIKNKYTDWEGLREKGKIVKENALNNLEERLLEFEKNATKNGMKIHWASTPKEANDIIFKIAKDNNIGKILKGKSMASEEIHMNAYMKEKGIEAVETDLGELIIQLIDEPPVHIVVPAIHKNRYEVGDIFHEKLGAKKESEPERLNAIARNHLREEFKILKMGLSGVNFAISKEGAIWLIENEGNGRMCTTYPDIHVAVCGIEKVVESFDDAVVLDTLLVPSATGQSVTNYNNIISSPRKKGQKDGPREVHVILLDNHRSRILAHEEYNEALRCIRCGACMNYCPVYEKIGGHAYQATYPGPIGEVISPQLFGMDKHGDVLSFCSLCNRCSEVCPVKIPLAEIIRKLRRDKMGEGANPPVGTEKLKQSQQEKQVFKALTFLHTNGNLYNLAVKTGSLFMPILNKFTPPVVKNWTKHRTMPQIKGDFQKRVKELEGVIYE
ncbi:MAG: iron-sulfur cluster-binding protein [Proteobacteria bacterium]|nr:MAG: iron-sulfur cluster-binding protein [Pseudomonadota bacterium]